MESSIVSEVAKSLGIPEQNHTKRCETVQDKLKRCELLKVIQHIDIYGKFRSSYAVPTRLRNNVMISYDCISSCSPKSRTPSHSGSSSSLGSRLDKLSVCTKVTGLWPGNDILSRKHTRLSKFLPKVKAC